MALKVTTTIMRLGNFERDLKTLNMRSKGLIREAIKETADKVADTARSLVPVSTAASRKAKGRPGPGELRNTIRVEMSSDPTLLVAYVKAGTGKLRRRSRAKAVRARAPSGVQPLGVYAMAVEYGTPHRGVPAEPYLRPALDRNRAGHTARVRAAVDRAMQETR